MKNLLANGQIKCGDPARNMQLAGHFEMRSAGQIHANTQFESTLERVDATDADFRGAYLVSANLCGANLSQAQFNEKTCFKNTKMIDVLLCGATGFDLRADESIIVGDKSESQLLRGEQAQAWLLDRSKM